MRSPRLYSQADEQAPIAVRFLEQPGVLADDFVVPTGTTWTITGVEVEGQLFDGSFRFGIFSDDVGSPARLLYTITDTSFSATLVREDENLYWVAFPNHPTLAAGRYWLGVYYPGPDHFDWREFPHKVGMALHFATNGGTWVDLGGLTNDTCCDLTFSLFGVSRRVGGVFARLRY